jgi:SAM-dependent MidA family methyltransferase
MHLKQLGGVTSFRQYMDLALNDPNHGFYGSGRAQISRDGDFVTSPAWPPKWSDGLLNYPQIFQHFH